MPDNTQNAGPADAMRINIHQDHELYYWTNKWKVSADDVREAVEKVGVMVKDVEDYLRKKLRTGR